MDQKRWVGITITESGTGGMIYYSRMAVVPDREAALRWLQRELIEQAGVVVSVMRDHPSAVKDGTLSFVRLQGFDG